MFAVPKKKKERTGEDSWAYRQINIVFERQKKTMAQAVETDSVNPMFCSKRLYMQAFEVGDEQKNQQKQRERKIKRIFFLRERENAPIFILYTFATLACIRCFPLSTPQKKKKRKRKKPTDVDVISPVHLTLISVVLSVFLYPPFYSFLFFFLLGCVHSNHASCSQSKMQDAKRAAGRRARKKKRAEQRKGNERTRGSEGKKEIEINEGYRKRERESVLAVQTASCRC